MIRSYICSTLHLKNKGENCFVMEFYNKQISQWFIDNQCIPKKSLVVKFPTIPTEFLFHFLRGVVDGDGCIRYSVSTSGGTTRRLRVTIATGSQEFAEALSNKLKEFEIKNFINRYLPKEGRFIQGKLIKTVNPLYTVHISDSSAIRFCEFLYKDSDKVFLQRKYNKFQEFMACREEDQRRIIERKEKSDLKKIGHLP
jgi:intein/homing endonuclease